MDEHWGNAPRRAPTFAPPPPRRRTAHLSTWALNQPQPAGEHAISKWQGKVVWGQVGSRRCQVEILRLSVPTGDGVVQFLVHPVDLKPSVFNMVAVPVTRLELKPPCTALMIAPVMAIVVWNKKAAG